MAKILLISEKTWELSVNLSRALKSQGHEVYFLTSKNSPTENLEGIFVLEYFERWNWKEAIAYLPTIWSIAPEILHLVLPTTHVSTAHLAIWLFGKFQKRSVLGISLFSIGRRLPVAHPLRWMLAESDLVTCPSADGLSLLRGITSKSKRQGKGILPPLMGQYKFLDQHKTNEQIEFQLPSYFSKFIVLPFAYSHFDPNDPFYQIFSICIKNHNVLLLGSTDLWTLRDRRRFQNWMSLQKNEKQWLISGKLSDQAKINLLAQANAFVLAGIELDPIELTNNFWLAKGSQTVLILDSDQSLVYAQLWVDRKTCWILPKRIVYEKLKGLTSQPVEEWQLDRAVLSEMVGQLIDAPMNELNRLYQKAMQGKPT